MIRGDGPLETETDYKTQKSTILAVTVLKMVIYYTKDGIHLQKKLQNLVLYKFDKQQVSNKMNREVGNHSGKRQLVLERENNSYQGS